MPFCELSAVTSLIANSVSRKLMQPIHTHQQNNFPPRRGHSVRVEVGPPEPSEPSGCLNSAYFPLRCVSQPTSTLQRVSPFHFRLYADAGDMCRPDLELHCTRHLVPLHTVFPRPSVCSRYTINSSTILRNLICL